MSTLVENRGRGLVVEPDDLQVDHYYAVLGGKNGSDDPHNITGIAFRILAINLPFLVGKVAQDPNVPPITADTRYLTFMKVSPEFVNAQRPDSDLFS
ncbi:MAG: hypothetical protein WCL32_07450 [Planctomycetota bacterium]